MASWRDDVPVTVPDYHGVVTLAHPDLQDLKAVEHVLTHDRLDATPDPRRSAHDRVGRWGGVPDHPVGVPAVGTSCAGRERITPKANAADHPRLWAVACIRQVGRSLSDRHGVTAVSLAEPRPG